MHVAFGHVAVASGRLVIVDGGLLHAWDPDEHGAAALAASSQPATMFDFGGPNLALLGGVAEGMLAISGERTDEGHWRWVDVAVRPGRTVATVDVVGEVIVDEARLMIADLDALGDWVHGASMDGKADLAFWGRDADDVAQELGAGKLPEGVWGWADLDVEAAEARYSEMEALKQARGIKFMADFRPHSHHFTVMAQVRSSPYEVGHLDVGGRRVCMLMTSHGDGMYPVLALRDASGELVGVRIDLDRSGEAEGAARGSTIGATAGLPPDPMSSTRTALTGAATSAATDYAKDAITDQIKEYLPEFLWPLIPGQGGNVAGNVAGMASNKLSSLFWGCLFSVVFFGIFGAVVLFFAIVVVVAVLSSM